MTLKKTIRFRMRPTAEQGNALARMAGARRFVWNWALAQRRACYADTGKSIPAAELSRRLTALKRQPETAWLSEVDSQALQQVLADLQPVATGGRRNQERHVQAGCRWQLGRNAGDGVHHA